MKTYQIRECEKCGKRSEDFKEIATCEASHLGLTLEEYREYQDLKHGVKAFLHMASRDSSDSTMNGLNIFNKDLAEFKEKHNIISCT